MLMCHYVIFRSACRIQTPSRPVSCAGGWVQKADSGTRNTESCCVTCCSLLCN